MNSLRNLRVSGAEQLGEHRRRRGIVLILSLGMLTLFTIVAITLASISRTQSTAAANFKRAEQYGRQNAGVRPEQVEDLFRYAMNQLIYDTRNPQSAVRGHSLLRDMYGSPDTYGIDRSGTVPVLSDVEGNGAELRLRKDDLKGLLNLPLNTATDSDPRLHYQGVYNGTGVPLPTKLITTGTTAPTLLDTRLTPAEIALQFAFPHMPVSVVPFGKTNVAIGSQNAFNSMRSDLLTTTPPGGVAAWFPRFTLSYNVFDPIGRRGATTTYPDGSMITPEKYFFGRFPLAPPPYAYPNGHHWFGADEDYDYPDVNNMYLALERADGRTLIPSFHRPGIIGQVAAGLMDLSNADGSPAAANVLSAIAASTANQSIPSRLSNVRQVPWLTSVELDVLEVPRDIRALVLRPRASDYDTATVVGGTPRAGRFREMADNFAKVGTSLVPGQDGLPDDLDGSGFVGDHPSELDVDTDGDGLNDAIWIDLGYRPVQVGDAIIKPLFAFKVLDLDGKLNLNVHGNMYRLALNDPTNTSGRANVNVLMQHSSHRGASVTEINPMHGLIIGDTSTNPNQVAIQAAPMRPRWLHNPSAARSPADVIGVSPALSSINNVPDQPYPYPHPYQRLLEGFTDAAGNYHPGRWSSPTRDATIPATPGRALFDDNGNSSPNSPSYLEGTFAGVDRVRTTLHSAGDGRAVLGSKSTTPPFSVVPEIGIPATASPRDLADQVGVGRTLSPFSKRALDLSDPSSTAPGISAIWSTAKVLSNLISSDADVNGDDGNLALLFINHQAVMGQDITNKLGGNNWGISFGIFSSLMGFSATKVEERNVPSELFTFEEALEVNPYNPLENEDFFYSAADLAALWRAGDIDGPSSGSRLTAILSCQVVSPTTDISATSASATAPGYTQIEYARKRQQRMFTHASWDLNRFSSPPGVGMASIGTLWGGSVPRGVGEVIESVLQSTTPPAASSVMLEMLRKHSASGVPSILKDQLTYLLPITLTPPTPLFPPTGIAAGFAAGPYPGATENARRALETLATRRTVDGRDFLIPYEVQMGRRFDLNRPMTAYALQTFSASSKLLRLPATGTGSITPPYDPATGTDPLIVTPDLVDLERQAMAQQLYVLLSIAAGLVGDNNPSGAVPQLIDTKLRIAQARVLAQIAVNIVDYMDPDSVMTQMVFDPYLADGWGDNTDSPTPISSTNLPAYPRLSNGTIDPAFGSAPPADQWRGTCTVIGFELPDLVINETMSLVQENIVEPPPTPGNPMPTPTRHEVLNTWVELMNPWPGTPDPVSPLTTSGEVVRGIRLYDPAVGQPRFMVGIANQAGGILPRLVTPTLTDNDPKYRELVRFDVAGTTTGQTNDGYFLPAAVAEPFVASRDGANRSPADTLTTGDYGYFVIGPDTNSNIESLTNPAQEKYAENTPRIGGDWDPSNANTLALTQDYAATACGQVLPQSSESAGSPTDMVVEVKLYRVRNPFQVFNPIENPYIVIDTVRMDAANRPAVEPFFERTGPAANPTSETPTASSYPGIYYAQDRTLPAAPNDALSKVPTWASGGQPESGRYSWQRRQPWHGWNSDWDPYQVNNPTVAATHPLVDSRAATGGLSARPINAEGLFLGLPSLALARNTTETMKFNALRQNGFIPAAPTFVKSTAGANPTRRTLNGTTAGTGLQDLKRWQTIPFANRQLATPLELLNVRLYGSHFWELPGVENIREWRLRFTDDFEFFSHAYAMPDNTGAMASNPYFERTWRSRQIPWFTSDRVTHPTWGDTAAAFNYTTALFDPTASTLSGQLRLRNQVQLPLGNLYRFFEFVECRSRLSNGKRPGEQWYGETIPAPPLVPSTAGGNVLRSAREDRVAGKINLNTITEEEVLQGLIDSVSTMYFDPGEYVQMVANYGASGAGLSNSALPVSLNFWPTDYWTGLFTPLGEYPLNDPNVGATFDMMGNLVPWRSLTFAQTVSASVLTPPGAAAAAAANRSVFEGGLSLAVLNGTVGLTAADWEVFPSPVGLIQQINSQWPGLASLPSSLVGIYPGTSPNLLVTSEMYRTFLLSRAGADGITGTADDRPFRSFAAADVEDTILRSRSPQTTGVYDPPTITINMTTGAVVPEASEVNIATSRTFMDGVEDITSAAIDVGGTPYSVVLGTSITRLGGQVTPRLFDPIPSPYADVASSAVQNLLYVGANPSFSEFNTQRPALDKAGVTATFQPTTLPVDYWMLDEKRNSILAKIGGNTTTRSHVFAVWVTVGFFRVEPGTENLKVPLLGAEVGSETGRAKRHRAFFVVDRSQATEYEPEDIDANFDLDRLRNRKVIDFYKIIE